MHKRPAPGFQDLQRAFAAHLRDPERSPAPEGLEDRRIGIYRELVFNNVKSLLAGSFPVLNRSLPTQRWQAMVRDFFIRHRACTPLFTELPQEFLHYLAQVRDSDPQDPPFLLELAHYEWVELALHLAEQDPDLSGIDPNGDLLAACPALSPLAWPLSYRFPVHRIGPDFAPAQAPDAPTCLLVYRNRMDQVEFMETNPVTHRLLGLLKEHPDRSGRRHLEVIAAEIGAPDPSAILAFGDQLLEALRARGAVLGTRPVPGARLEDCVRDNREARA